MTRWRRLLRAKSSTDLTVVALVLCACVFFFRQLNQRAAVHHRLHGSAAAGDDDDADAGGQLLEISLNDGQTRQQQQQQPRAASQMQVPLQQSQRAHEVDPRIMHIGDFRSADCRAVSQVLVSCSLPIHSELQWLIGDFGRGRITRSGRQVSRGSTADRLMTCGGKRGSEWSLQKLDISYNMIANVAYVCQVFSFNFVVHCGRLHEARSLPRERGQPPDPPLNSPLPSYVHLCYKLEVRCTVVFSNRPDN